MPCTCPSSVQQPPSRTGRPLNTPGGGFKTGSLLPAAAYSGAGRLLKAPCSIRTTSHMQQPCQTNTGCPKHWAAPSSTVYLPQAPVACCADACARLEDGMALKESPQHSPKTASACAHSRRRVVDGLHVAWGAAAAGARGRGCGGPGVGSAARDVARCLWAQVPTSGGLCGAAVGGALRRSPHVDCCENPNLEVCYVLLGGPCDGAHTRTVL